MIEKLKSRIGDISVNSPILLLGEAANIFKNNYHRDIFKPNSIEECINFIATYEYKGNTLVIDLCSFFLNNPLIILFFRTIMTPTIILSSGTIDINILSSFKTVIKYSTKANSNLANSISAQKTWKEELNKSNIQSFYAKESPELYYYKNKYRMTKYIDLFSTSDS